MLAPFLVAIAASLPLQRPVSFVVVITDDQRNDMLGCAGHPVLETPVMDGLSARGARFENGFVTTPICAASRASILASRYESNHGFTFGTGPIPKALTDDSWPVRLRDAGWRTAHVGKWGMKTEVNPRRLFDAFVPLSPPYRKKGDDGDETHLTNLTGTRAIGFLDSLDEDDPFALTISFNAPHAEDANPLQYIWADEEAGLYGDTEIPLPELANEAAYGALPPFLRSAMGRERFDWRFDEEEKRVEMTRGYYRMISGVDRNLGRVLARLEELGRAEDTVVVLLGDNGYFLGERGLAGKWLIYEESIRVPILVMDPRVAQGARGRTPSEMALNVDIGPTVLDLAGLEVPKSYQGRSLVPLLRGPAEDWRTSFLVEHHMHNQLLPKHRGLRTAGWAYSHFYELPPPNELLFDLEQDPRELRNLAGVQVHQGKLAELRAQTQAEVRRLAPGLVPAELRCDGQLDPLGAGGAPELSWRVESRARGAYQAEYQILVATTRAELARDEGTLWDSGRVTTPRAPGVRYSGEPLTAGNACHWKVRVFDAAGRPSPWSAPASFEVAPKTPEGWHGARWISVEPARDGAGAGEEASLYDPDPAPILSTEFEVTGSVRRARLRVVGLGACLPSLDGEPLPDSVLDPPWTAFQERILFRTHDVTGALREGRHRLSLTLGNGWWNPLPLRMWGRINLREHLAIGEPRAIACLEIHYADGTVQRVVTDETWSASASSTLRNSVYLGEERDGRVDARGAGAVRVTDDSLGVLEPLAMPPVRGVAPLPARGITAPEAGTYIVDFGENFTGVPELDLDVPAGTRVVLRYGELLNADGSLNPMTSVAGQIKGTRQGPDGEEISVGGPGAPPVAFQGDVFWARGGGPETLRPRFTFHGFRYMEIKGLPKAPLPGACRGIPLRTDLEPVGEFSCSSERLNAIQAMCRRTFLANVVSVQSDCPHRERFAYGGDIVATSAAYLMNFRMAEFYRKTVRDWADAARDDGRFTDTAPLVGIDYCGVGWSMVHPLLLEQLYRHYGDESLLAEQLPAALRWIDGEADRRKDGLVVSGLGDHESLEPGQGPAVLTPMFVDAAARIARLARIAGRVDDAERLDAVASESRRAWADAFLDPTTGQVADGTQSKSVLALAYGAAPDDAEEAVFGRLVEDLTKDPSSPRLTTGIFGTRHLLDELSRRGRTDLAFALANRSTFPSWGWMLENGATTLWEHWEGSDNTFSHNHPMFGSISEWFFQWLGGIQPAPDAVGFDRIHLRPQVVDGLTHASASHRSVRGLIRCSWKKQGQGLRVEVTTPPDTEATLWLPFEEGDEVTERGRTLKLVAGVKEVSAASDQSLRIELTNGTFAFSIRR